MRKLLLALFLALPSSTLLADAQPTRLPKNWADSGKEYKYSKFLDPRLITGFELVDDHAIIVTHRVRERWQIEIEKPCSDLPWADAVRFDTGPISRVDSFTKVYLSGSGTSPAHIPCRITNITALPPKSVKKKTEK
jgi:hypothetical protein